MQIQTTDNGSLTFSRRGEHVQIEPWGPDAFRVCAVMSPAFPEGISALLEPAPAARACVRMAESVPEETELASGPHTAAILENGMIAVHVSAAGQLAFFRTDSGELLLDEYSREEGSTSRRAVCLRVPAREWKPLPGSDLYRVAARFEAPAEEHLFGMGQYQQSRLDLRGCQLELAQRNSQISVPFVLSSRGYGFLWNNPAVGRVSFGHNLYEWTAEAAGRLDYWITAGGSPADILRTYTGVTGRAGTFPRELLGLWQSKLRYRTQAEVLEVARAYHQAGIPLSQIVIDFFHWTYQGDWKFDPVYWPDPKAMVDELHRLGIRVMVSVWPSVDRRSENYETLYDRGLLLRTERGSGQAYDYQGDCSVLDAFSSEAVRFLWDRCRESYYDIGFDGFWLDNCEPDLVRYDFDNFRYCAGPALQVSNAYPQELSKGFYTQMHRANPEKPVVNLVRSCWAGSQRYGNVVWSGDVPGTFEAFRDQIQAGLNMGMAGIPWWTTDIGGFQVPDRTDPEFLELLVRWFEYAVFCPVLRMHGSRGPFTIPPLDTRDWGGGYLFTGQPNEIWSYGEDIERILRVYLGIRESLRDPLADLFEEASQTGAPVMRPMFFHFPDEPECWNLSDQYMLGEGLIVAPVTEYKARRRRVYLPEGRWELSGSGTVFDGGQYITVQAPLAYIPTFVQRSGAG